MLCSENKAEKCQCTFGVKVVLVQVLTAHLVFVTVALKCFLILFVNHPEWLQHCDHAEVELEKFFSLVVWFGFFGGGRGVVCVASFFALR